MKRSSAVRTGGFTIVEMLVSMVITLIMLFAIVQVFSLMGDGVNAGRATIEMAGQLRQTAHLLQKDLDGLTCRTLPWARANSGGGYFEYFEGENWDANSINFQFDQTAPDPWVGVVGDIDDILMFTVRSKGDPFVFHKHRTDDGNPVNLPDGSPVVDTIESPVAEVAWFAVLGDLDDNGVRNDQETYTIIRKVLPVLPRQAPHRRGDAVDVGGRGFTLDELTLRQNRFAHGGSFPYPIILIDDDANTVDLVSSIAFGTQVSTNVVQGGVVGEDVVLTNVLSFDVRAYDPLVPEVVTLDFDTPHVPQDVVEYVSDANQVATMTYSEALVEANDVGTECRFHLPPYKYGAYVNLGHGTPDPEADIDAEDQFVGLFAYVPTDTLASGAKRLGYVEIGGGYAGVTWDTWPFFYEQDGAPQDNDSLVDEGTNGLDDDGVTGMVDDLGERETFPPYPYPLRGIQIRIRVLEPDTGQVRQATVVADFVPG